MNTINHKKLVVSIQSSTYIKLDKLLISRETEHFKNNHGGLLVSVLW